ncbi:MAG: hypothetical protein H6563_05355 [Lewinellaceae bacterium]|nr:hypothetical protein [Lewinellaceae bacterium]
MRLFARVLIIYWILGSLFPQADFSQLRNLPFLYRHFQMHREEAAANGASLSVGTFILMHYAAGSAHQHPGDSNSHQQLPFKSLQDIQWVGGKQLALFLPDLSGNPSCFLGSAGYPLLEGIRASVFRPPLAG